LSHYQEKLQKIYFEMCNKNINTIASTKDNIIIYFLREAKLFPVISSHLTPAGENSRRVEFT